MFMLASCHLSENRYKYIFKLYILIPDNWLYSDLGTRSLSVYIYQGNFP